MGCFNRMLVSCYLLDAVEGWERQLCEAAGETHRFLASSSTHAWPFASAVVVVAVAVGGVVAGGGWGRGRENTTLGGIVPRLGLD